MKKINNKKILEVFALQSIIVIYTLSGIFGKIASRYAFLSLSFLVFYGIELFILGCYAILWQQVIKKFDLAIAYANRGVAIFWSMLWSVFFFGEHISLQNIAGVAIIFSGVLLINTEKAEDRGA